LDEIGELPLSVQVKLLRVLDSGEFTPLGANLPLTASARVVAATNRNLEEEMAKGNFRPDLYYRLNVLNLELPPLNQRKEDIPILVDYFLESLAAERGQAVSHVSSEAMALLLDHPWPGNVRQLQNAIEHALVLAGGGEINPVHLPNSIQKQAQSDSGGVSLADKERKAIEAALTRNHGNRARTAAELGISTTTLWRRLKHYGLV
jgi:transcriptional regulator with PAS, ATPase and Fis domain